MMMKIEDETETNLIHLRRTIYFTIQSTLDFEEAGHKLSRIKLKSGQEMELCLMILECCRHDTSFRPFYGLLGQSLCLINDIHRRNFQTYFVHQYSTTHRLQTNQLRNVAKFFAHLLGSDALNWRVLDCICLTEEDTNSSSRIFVKILFQELCEILGIRLLNRRIGQHCLDSVFRKDNLNNTRFVINFFTSIGLGGITENLREHLIVQQHESASSSESDHRPKKRRRN